MRNISKSIFKIDKHFLYLYIHIFKYRHFFSIIFSIHIHPTNRFQEIVEDEQTEATLETLAKSTVTVSNNIYSSTLGSSTNGGIKLRVSPSN